MANLKDVRSKAVKITLLDGKERTVKFTLNAMAELEDRYGSVDAAFAELEKNSVKALRCVLWAGFLEDEPNLTEQQVGSLIDIAYMNELMELLGEAFDQDMPTQDANALAAASAQAASVGGVHADGTPVDDPNV